ncbi:nitroreductase family protein [Parasphingorhabdus sp.]|uniref:nitroreductase family protein n=1 Tax=Parasphingorhabdus sp. TaxID=2709688 RepID=UPI003A903D23
MRFYHLIRYNIILPFNVRVFWPLAVRYRFFSRLYYFVFNGAFDGEMQGAIAGKLRYYKKNASRQANLYLLRRNIHRLEKGLIMRPRRPVFAVSYVEQAVNGLETACDSDDLVLLRWAHDVLAEYFAVTSNVPETDRARASFRQLTQKIEDKLEPVTEASIPYVLKKAHPISIEQFRRLAVERRSVRWYKPKKVERQLLEEALEVALCSPSACNRQPFRFMAFDDPDSVRAIASIPAGTKGFVDNIPLIVAVVGELDAFVGEADRHLIYIDAGLAAMSFMYALEAQGLSSCPVNWPTSASHDRRFKALTGIGDHQRVVMLIAVGYQDEERLVARSRKSQTDQVLSFNHPLSLEKSQ